MKKTKIEWCDATINPVVGCTFGCPYCYAKKLNDRFHFIKDWTKPQFFPERLKQLECKKPQNIFMNSMSDIADWPQNILLEVSRAIYANLQHHYLFLTKRPAQSYLLISPNVWLGVSVTSRLDVHRIVSLNRHNATKKFVSFEPLHDFIGVDGFLDRIDWVIIGAETGNRKDKIVPKLSWINNIVNVAQDNGIPVFMKDSLIQIVGEKNMLREFPKELMK